MASSTRETVGRVARFTDWTREEHGDDVVYRHAGFNGQPRMLRVNYTPTGRVRLVDTGGQPKDWKRPEILAYLRAVDTAARLQATQ